MTPAELDAIEARASAATPGPWVFALPTQGGFVVWVQATHLGPCRMMVDVTCVENENDAAFIAACRTDVPALVTEVRRLHQELRWSYENYEAAMADGGVLKKENMALREALEEALDRCGLNEAHQDLDRLNELRKRFGLEGG